MKHTQPTVAQFKRVICYAAKMSKDIGNEQVDNKERVSWFSTYHLLCKIREGIKKRGRRKPTAEKTANFESKENK